jgi:hypothetical protein
MQHLKILPSTCVLLFQQEGEALIYVSNRIHLVKVEFFTFVVSNTFEAK